MTAFDIGNEEELNEDNIESDSNDEMSEDDINEYERTMMEFNESEEEDNSNDEEETNQEEPDEEVIIDKPFNNKQMPQTSSEFAPYLRISPNCYSFFWTEKHHICMFHSFETLNNVNLQYFLSATQAYDELVDIIRYSQFKIEDVVPNIRQFRKYRQRLPLLSIKSSKVSISKKKTPSTSKDIGEAYYLSILDILCHILNKPLLFNSMYFGPGQEIERNKELWHGNIWKESARFGQASITVV